MSTPKEITNAVARLPEKYRKRAQDELLHRLELANLNRHEQISNVIMPWEDGTMLSVHTEAANNGETRFFKFCAEIVTHVGRGACLLP